MSEKIIGTEININAFSSKAELNISGNNKQETREGYNLFDEKSFVENNSEYYELENGEINSTKIDQRSTNFTWGTYLEEGTYTIITTNNCNIRIYQADSLPMSTSANVNTIASVNNKKTYTFTNSQKYIAIKLFSPNSVVPYQIGNVMIIKGTKEKTYESYGIMPSPDFPSKVNGVKNNVEIIISSKNLFKLPESKTLNGITYINNGDGTFDIKGTTTEQVTFSIVMPISESGFIEGDSYTINSNYPIGDIKYYIHNCTADGYWSKTQLDFTNETTKTKVFQTSTTSYISCNIVIYKNLTIDYKNIQIQIEKGEESTYFVPYQNKKITMPIQEEMFNGDTFEVIDGILYEKHNWKNTIINGIDTDNLWGYSQITSTIGSDLIGIVCSTTNEKTNGAIISENLSTKILGSVTDTTNVENVRFFEGIASHTTTSQIVITLKKSRLNTEDFNGAIDYLKNNNINVLYELKEPTYIEATQDQKIAYEQMQNIILFSGENHVYTTNELKPLLILEYYKIIEDFDLYLSENGHLIIREFGIDLLVNLSESNIPTMPEAIETTVRIAGKDGDVVLKTTYEPISFEIVCYTEDNLTMQEKVAEEKKINRFLNSIKSKTKTFAIEINEVFYKIKYNAALTTIKYPKHIQFSIPFKSSESYGKALIQSSIVGNNTTTSETIEPTGAIFKIDGPAQTPKIALNDYLMQYDNILLEGEQLIINSLNSTVTLINTSGIETNAMSYYNHEFPQIQNGTNELKVLSGIENENQVQVKWYDLKL